MAFWSQAVDAHDLPARANVTGLRLATRSHARNVPATVDLHAEGADFKPQLPQQHSRRPARRPARMPAHRPTLALLSRHAVQRSITIGVSLPRCVGRCLTVAEPQRAHVRIGWRAIAEIRGRVFNAHNGSLATGSNGLARQQTRFTRGTRRKRAAVCLHAVITGVGATIGRSIIVIAAATSFAVDVWVDSG